MAREFVSGVGGLLKASAHADFVITGDLSFACWLMVGSGNEVDDRLINIQEEGEAESANAVLFLDFKGSSGAWDIRYIHEYSSGSNEANTFNTNLGNGTWYHLAIVRDVSANTVKLYVDGAENGTFNYTNDPTCTASSLPVRIGQNETEDDNLMDDVKMAEVLIANAAWGGNTVKGIMREAITAPGLVSYWPLHGIRSPEPDFSPKGHSLTVTDTQRANHPPVTGLNQRRLARAGAPLIESAAPGGFAHSQALVIA